MYICTQADEQINHKIKHGKLRRKSILHTIRNSLISEKSEGMRNSQMPSSLSKGPSRAVITSQIPSRSRSSFARNNASNINSNSNRVPGKIIKKKVISKPKDINSRPAFR